jgi:uncharacterized protein (UPF0303 family)
MAQPSLVLAQERELTFPSFDATIAWFLGQALRSRILALPADIKKPVLISICLAGSSQPHVVFQCATEPGTRVDHAVWVQRKVNTVLRWQVSTWFMRCHLKDKNRLASSAQRNLLDTLTADHPLSRDDAEEYAIHAGGFPIRVKGVEGIVGVVSISGLAEEAADHQVIIEVLQEFKGGHWQ